MFRKINVVFGGGNALTAFLVMLLALSMAVGCNGQRSPMDSDATGAFGRSAQIFPNGIEWGTGYSMDSASTMWAYRVPNGGCPGNLAVWDEGLEVSPLVTAFVRHDNYEAPSSIHLLMVDAAGVPVLPDMSFAAPPNVTGSFVTFARHPAVEVTYWRLQGAPVGFLEVQIVWSQLSGPPENQHWDLYYEYMSCPVDQYGVHWMQGFQAPITRIDSEPSGYDELQVDLCVHAPTGDLYAAFLGETSEGNDAIYMVTQPNMGFYYPMWQAASQVSSTTDTPKLGPRLDAGLISLTEPPDEATPSVMVVWTENDPDDDWQIFSNRFTIPGSPSSGATQQITDQLENSNCFLPQIDITPECSGVHQAVLTWVVCYEVDNEYVDPEVEITATPFASDSIETIEGGRWSHCPDVACYQMMVPNPGPDSEHWFGLSYYWSDEYENPWEVRTQSYSFGVDWDGEHVVFESKYSYWLDDEYDHGWWTAANPFTGTTVCLRDPSYAEVDGEPIDDVFGLGWVDEDYMCKVTEGSIYPD